MIKSALILISAEADREGFMSGVRNPLMIRCLASVTFQVDFGVDELDEIAR